MRMLLDTYTPGGAAFRVRSITPFYNWLIAEEEITANPFKGIRITVPEKVQTTADELIIEAMLAREKGMPRDRAMLIVMADTGCRKGEVAALECQHLDIHNRLSHSPCPRRGHGSCR